MRATRSTIPQRARHLRVGAVAALWIAAAPYTASAGPPFITDDPVPTDLGHWEIYNFAALARVDGTTGGQAGLDLNYGMFKDVQLTAVLPLGYDSRAGRSVGLSNIELAAKFRVLHQVDGALTPDLAVFPRLFTPTGGRRFGTGRAQLLLPVWAGKDFGPWSVFGGGGYEINLGAGNRNFWLSGIGVSRAVTKRLSLGVEAYHHTADSDDGAAFTGVNLGALYKLNDHWSLLGSGGPGVQNARREGNYAFYAALKADY